LTRFLGNAKATTQFVAFPFVKSCPNRTEGLINSQQAHVAAFDATKPPKDSTTNGKRLAERHKVPLSPTKGSFDTPLSQLGNKVETGAKKYD
jgi:hypothetical protein